MGNLCSYGCQTGTNGLPADEWLGQRAKYSCFRALGRFRRWKRMPGIILAVPGSGLLRTLARSGEQVAVTDRYGWAYFCNNGLFLTDSNQVRPAVKEAGAYAAGLEDLIFTSVI